MAHCDRYLSIFLDAWTWKEQGRLTLIGIKLVSSPGRDSRDSRSSRLAEATQKALGTNALCTGSRILIWFLPHIYPIFTKSFFKSLEIITILRPF